MHAHRLLPRPWSSRHAPATLAALALGLLLAASALHAQPAQTETQPSVDALVAALSGGPSTRSFMRTALPDAGSSLCSGQAVTAAPAAGRQRQGQTTRTLEVVPYAGDTTPGINLGVQFAHGSDKLTAADQTLLNNLATALKTPALAQDSFAVAGHTDTSGDARINLELSCARALAVRRFLAGKGVALQRISAYGFGSMRLLAADQPTDSSNRRVEVRKAPE